MRRNRVYTAFKQHRLTAGKSYSYYFVVRCIRNYASRAKRKSIVVCCQYAEDALGRTLDKSNGRAKVSGDRLARVIARSWSRETSYDPSGWSEKNSAWGQCAVSALVVQDLLGGELLVGKVNGIEHYWNRLADNREFDLTKDQFGHIKSFEGPRRVDREFVISFPHTRRRYERLRRKVLAQLKASNVAGDEKKLAAGRA